MRPRPTRFAVRAVLAIVLSAGCSPSERLVLVNVKTSPEELGTSISSLNVKSVFENQTLVIKEFPVSLGIYVPRETRGTLTVTVDGLDRNATLVATGMQDFPLKGGSVEQIEMTLVLVASGQCPDLSGPPPDGGSGSDGGVAVPPECDAYCTVVAASCPDLFGGVPAACPELCARASLQPPFVNCLTTTFTETSAQGNPNACKLASFAGGECMEGCEAYCALGEAVCGATFTSGDCTTSCDQAGLSYEGLECRERELALALGDPRHCDLARIATTCSPCAH